MLESILFVHCGTWYEYPELKAGGFPSEVQSEKNKELFSMFVYLVSQLWGMRVTRRIVWTLLSKALYKFGCSKEKVWSFLKFWIWQCCYFTELPWHVFARWQLTQVSKKGAEIDKEEEKVNLNFPHGWSYWKVFCYIQLAEKSTCETSIYSISL